MTPDELKRLRIYYLKLDAAQGDMSVLSPEESEDCENLLTKRLVESEPKEVTIG